MTKPGLKGPARVGQLQPLQLPEEAVRRKLSGHARTRVPMSHCSRRFPARRSRRAHAFAAPHLPPVRPYHLSLNPATLTETPNEGNLNHGCTMLTRCMSNEEKEVLVLNRTQHRSQDNTAAGPGLLPSKFPAFAFALLHPLP